MIEARSELDLTQESIGTERRGQVWMENLERDKAFVFRILSKIDRGHPAAAQFSVYRVITCERVAYSVERSAVHLHSLGKGLKAHVLSQRIQVRIVVDPFFVSEPLVHRALETV